MPTKKKENYITRKILSFVLFTGFTISSLIAMIIGGEPISIVFGFFMLVASAILAIGVLFSALDEADKLKEIKKRKEEAGRVRFINFVKTCNDIWNVVHGIVNSTERSILNSCQGKKRVLKALIALVFNILITFFICLTVIWIPLWVVLYLLCGAILITGSNFFLILKMLERNQERRNIRTTIEENNLED